MKTMIIGHHDLGKVVEVFNERSWVKQGTWPGSLLWFAAILESFSEEWTGSVLDPRLAISDYACIGQPHGAYDCLIGARCFEEIRQVMEQAYDQMGPVYFRDYADLCERKCQEWMQFAQSVAERHDELEQLSNDELVSLLRQYFAHLRENGAFMDTIIVLADLLGDKVGSSIDALLRSHSIDDPSAYGLFLEIHLPQPLPTNITLSEASLREITRQVQESPELCELFTEGTPRSIASALEDKQDSIYAAIETHIKQFGWLNTYSFIGRPFSLEDIIGFIQEKLDTLAETDEKDLDTVVTKPNDVLYSQLRNVNLSPELRGLLEVTHTLTYINTAKDDAHQITWQAIQPLIKAVALRLDCEVTDLTMFTPSELEDALCKNYLRRELLASRAEAWGLIKAFDVIYLIQGKRDMEFLRGAIKPILPADITMLTGRPIFPGIVRGRVRLVLTAQDCDKVQPGDILVATNTNPDFIPAMRRAGAFVTDTGNLICHAVIAAREFKKPCVIATGIATQVLADGEWIEMDGTIGTVTKIAAPQEA